MIGRAPGVLFAALCFLALAPVPASAGQAPASGPDAVDSESAERLFEKLRNLEGEWIGTSTRGWRDRSRFRTIAGGSVVVQTSFDAHPGETMMTMYHLDGGRLLLTHYCVAKNQPRLVASSIDGTGNTVTFSYLDATGIATRDAGHMDKAEFAFDGESRFTSRWTWYQDGKEKWLEEILYERAPAGSPGAGGTAD